MGFPVVCRRDAAEKKLILTYCRFKDIAGLVKETKESTRTAVQSLCKM